MNEEPSYFLFARPSFTSGAASLLDFGNTLFVYNESPSTEAADDFAAKADWMAVAKDVWHAIRALGADRNTSPARP